MQLITYKSIFVPNKVINSYDRIQLTIRIPISGMQELHAYQKGILGVLSEIDIDNASLGLEDHLKRVYQLLSHLLLDEEFLNRHGAVQ